MKKAFFFLIFNLLLSAFSYGQGKVLNIPELLQLVGYSKSEYRLQVNARDQQATVTGTETANNTLLGRIKAMYRTLQSRYSTLGTAISAADIGIEASPLISRIARAQSQLYQLARQNPAIIPLAYRTEIDFVNQSQMLIRYLAGLVLSTGDLNQMKSSDRKLLFDFVISELSHIEDMSNRLVTSVRIGSLATLLHHLNPFDDFVYTDTKMVQDILNNAKYLRR